QLLAVEQAGAAFGFDLLPFLLRACTAKADTVRRSSLFLLLLRRALFLVAHGFLVRREIKYISAVRAHILPSAGDAAPGPLTLPGILGQTSLGENRRRALVCPFDALEMAS